MNDKRCETQEKDILDKEYLFNLNENKILMPRYITNYYSYYIYIEFLINQICKRYNKYYYEDKDNDRDDPDNINNIDVDREMGQNEIDKNEKAIKDFFGFRLITEDNEEFFFIYNNIQFFI